MKVVYYVMLLIILSITVLYSADKSKTNIDKNTVSDRKKNNPEIKDFAFTGIGYQQNPGALYKASTGGRQFYIDPINGSPEGNGSKMKPWQTLQQVIEGKLIETWSFPSDDLRREKKPRNSGAPVKGGDILILKNGSHGSIVIRDSFNDNYITIRAAEGEHPRINSISFISAGNWRVDGLDITLEQETDKFNAKTLMTIDSKKARSKKIEFYNNIIYSIWDSSKWSKEDWNRLSCNGGDVDGDFCLIKNNYFRNVNTGINVRGEHNDITNNTVKNFAGDGMRGLGNYLLFEKNFIKNVYRVNSNHADGFQSFCLGKTTELHNVILRKNVILNYDDISQPFSGPLQGIGCFDGFYRHWIIENNLIVTNHFHGITLMGATDSIIRKNIVLDINSIKPGPLGINVRQHKDKRQSENCIIKDNITEKIIIEIPNKNVTQSGNRLISEKEKTDIFTDPSNLDFTLKAQYLSFIQ